MNYENKYLKYKKKYLLLKNQIGGAKKGEYIRDIKTKTELGRIVDEANTYYLVEDSRNKWIFMMKEQENITWEVFRKEYLNKSSIVNENIEYPPRFYELSKEILTQKILNQEMIKYIDKKIKEDPLFESYLMDVYYFLFKEPKILIPKKRQEFNIIYKLANKIVDKLITDVQDNTKEDRKHNKYIILAPGDTSSKVVSYILLIQDYIEKLEENNIDIILFPLSNAPEWDDISSRKYIEKLLTPYEKYDKSNLYFGYLDAIAAGETIKLLNKSLKALGYPNIIEEPIEEPGHELWHPKFGYNFIYEDGIFQTAEKNNGIRSRCMPNYEMANYKSDTIDDEDYKHQLYNCNIYIYYWYKIRNEKAAVPVSPINAAAASS
jgi:hypothetical protein